MINRIFNLAVISLSIFFAANSNADIIPATCVPNGFPGITHAQDTLGSERIITCDYLDNFGYPHPAITRDYTIVNNTSVPWTDYHFDVFISADEFIDGSLAWDTSHQNFSFALGTFENSGRQFSVYFTNPLGVGEQFLVNSLRYGTTNGGSTWVNGTPSVSVPVPGSLSLLVLGLLGLRFSVRKFRRSGDGAIRNTTV